MMRGRIAQLDEDGLTPLHYAARYSHLQVVKLLVERGADVNARAEDGITPLHFAARYKRTNSRLASGRLAAPRLVKAKSLVGTKPCTGYWV